MAYTKESLTGSRYVTLVSDTTGTAVAGPSVGTITSVNDAATSTTLLAANTSRKGVTIYNDSTSLLYLALADVTASATVYSAQVPAGVLYEMPLMQGGVYTGIIKGIWASDASGAARITEFT